MTTVSSATTQPQAIPRVSFVEQHQTTSKKVGALFLKMASHLTWPICWCSSAVHRFKSPMIVGKYDFAPTESEEKTTRLAYKAGLVLMAPIGVVGGALGILFRFIGNQLQQDEYAYRASHAAEKPFQNVPFSVMTWNLCGLGGGMCRSHGGVVEWEKRAEGIVKQVRDEDPDILCCQEVQDEHIALEMYEQLKDVYPHFFWNFGPHTYGSNSGLFIACKFPPKDLEFVTYRDAIGSAKWIHKGFARLALRDESGKGADIITSHLQHAGDKESRATREKQIRQMLGHVQSLHIDPKEKSIPKFLLGDLNVDRNTDEIETSSLFKHFRHGYNSTDETCSDFLCQDLWDATDEERKKGITSTPERIDYISLLTSTPDGEELPVESAKMYVHRVLAYEKSDPSSARSDHHALSGMIRV